VPPLNVPDGVTTAVATAPLSSSGVTSFGSVKVNPAPAMAVFVGSVPVRAIFRTTLVLAAGVCIGAEEPPPPPPPQAVSTIRRNIPITRLIILI
jgi:hypothetical protein